MNFLQRLWYSTYELVTNRSIYSDTPRAGVVLVLDVWVMLFGLSILMLWECLSIVYSILSPNLEFSKIQIVVIMGGPFLAIYYYSKKKGIHPREKFKEEDEKTRILGYYIDYMDSFNRYFCLENVFGIIFIVGQGTEYGMWSVFGKKTHKSIYLVDGVAHNPANFGNFLYGAACEAFGFSLFVGYRHAQSRGYRNINHNWLPGFCLP